jgi:hypothetical protein
LADAVGANRRHFEGGGVVQIVYKHDGYVGLVGRGFRLFFSGSIGARTAGDEEGSYASQDTEQGASCTRSVYTASCYSGHTVNAF